MKKKTDDQKDEIQRQIDECKSKYLRALADYQNLEKRTSEDKQEIRKYAAERLIIKLLPVLDTLLKAQSHLGDKGLDLVIKEFQTILTEQGVVRIEVFGKEFNPYEMECVEAVEGNDNMVVEEVLPGYTIHGKVLRVAQVKVGRDGTSTNAQSTNVSN